VKAILLVALGGAIGSVARYEVGAWVPAVVLAGLGERHGFLAAEMRLLLFTGFLGGFTTFSAFGVETVALIERGAWNIAVAYVVLSVLCGVLALWAALKLSGVATH